MNDDEHYGRVRYQNTRVHAAPRYARADYMLISRFPMVFAARVDFNVPRAADVYHFWTRVIQMIRRSWNLFMSGRKTQLQTWRGRRYLLSMSPALLCFA